MRKKVSRWLLDKYMSKCSYIHMSQPQIVEHPFEKECGAPHLDAVGSDERRRALMPPATVEVLAETFRVLGDPTRVRILDVLANGELCVCDIASLVQMSESAVSHQLRLLRHMRLVRARRAHHILELLRLAGTHVQEPGSPSSL
jgi:ArsR family transcriptional regulator, lead/cadmium/zinc/bismuth-responsive transcriptional repressor